MESQLHVQFDATAKRVQAAELLRFRDLALSAKRVEPPPAEAAARLLADEIIAGRLPLPNWDHGVEQWLARLRLLCRHCPELQLPPITDDDRKHIIEQLCQGAVGYKDIKEREVRPLVMSWLSGTQRELLDKHAPERLTLPNGRTPRVVYEDGKPPHIALRIQELYDVNQTPKIAMGRVPVLVHILTPGMKPVQSRRTGRLLARTLSRLNPSCSGNIRSTCGGEWMTIQVNRRGAEDFNSELSP